jgi:hypothetical protein
MLDDAIMVSEDFGAFFLVQTMQRRQETLLKRRKILMPSKSKAGFNKKLW